MRVHAASAAAAAASSAARPLSGAGAGMNASLACEGLLKSFPLVSPTRAMSSGSHPTPYANYSGTVPRIASVLTPLSDDNLALVAQIGVTGAAKGVGRARAVDRPETAAGSGVRACACVFEWVCGWVGVYV